MADFVILTRVRKVVKWEFVREERKRVKEGRSVNEEKQEIVLLKGVERKGEVVEGRNANWVRKRVLVQELIGGD